MPSSSSSNGAPFGFWMVAQRNHRRPVQMTAGSSGAAAMPPNAADNGGDQGRRPTAERSHGDNLGNGGAGSRFPLLNKQNDVQAVDGTNHNGNDAGACATEEATTDRRREVDKGKEPMRASTQTSENIRPKVNVSHAVLSDGQKDARKVDHAEAVKLATKADGPKKNKDRVLNDIITNWILSLSI